LRDYIFTHQIEKRLNQGLNNVLAKCNADPFSEMASALIDSVKKPPKFERFQASETTMNSEGMSTISIKVFANYQGQTKLASNYLLPYSQNDIDSGEFCYDDKAEKTGFTKAIEALNGPLSTFFKGK
jgi:hypothetical protein